MELLKKLYQIYSPSGKERAMTKFIWDYVKRIPGVKLETDKIGNLYITKGDAESYPCIAAHLDQVQRLHSKDFTAIETEEIIFGYSSRNKRQEGLGADDKNGIWIALKCLEKYKILKLAFFVSEEKGCVGSENAVIDFFANCRFVIEPDRKGCQDIITEINWTSLCSPDFLKATGHEKFGYKETDGMMTDILALKEKGLGISCVNLSCGYYEPHTDHEVTVKEDLMGCLRLVEHIIGNCTETYPHQPEIQGRREGIYDEFDEAADEIFALLDQEDIWNVEDLYYMYHSVFPDLNMEDYQRIYTEYYNLYPMEEHEDEKILS